MLNFFSIFKILFHNIHINIVLHVYDLLYNYNQIHAQKYFRKETGSGLETVI